jgi:hypothetical protein
VAKALLVVKDQDFQRNFETMELAKSWIRQGLIKNWPKAGINETKL